MGCARGRASRIALVLLELLVYVKMSTSIYTLQYLGQLGAQRCCVTSPVSTLQSKPRLRLRRLRCACSPRLRWRLSVRSRSSFSLGASRSPQACRTPSSPARAPRCCRATSAAELVDAIAPSHGPPQQRKGQAGPYGLLLDSVEACASLQ